MKPKVSKTKNGYQKILSVYESRREDLRLKYKPKHKDTKKSDIELYKKAVEKINYKIKICKKALRRIEVIEQQLNHINKMMVEFNGISVKLSSHNTTKEVNLTRHIFYRYCVEAGISSVYISRFCGMVDETTASRGRFSLIRSFKTKPENREMWYRWLDFLKYEQAEKQLQNAA